MRRKICRWPWNARAEFSPHIEENPPDTVIFDVRGLESLYGPPERLASRDRAQRGSSGFDCDCRKPLYAAMHAAFLEYVGMTVIAPGREAEVLAPLPVNLLRGSAGKPPSCCILWGIRTFGELAGLPPLGVAARLGEEGMHLQRLARGDGYRQLRPIADPLRIRR